MPPTTPRTAPAEITFNSAALADKDAADNNATAIIPGKRAQFIGVSPDRIIVFVI